ncbi:MAG: hypothetical protein IKG70_01265 [Lachnospiraceae bacterium]|nr:hypothetical protein [Lachnospiraceae bacterium]
MNISAFSESELNITGTFTICPGWPPVPRRDYPISPRENLNRALRREGALWIPSFTTDILQFNSRVIPDCIARGEVRDLGPAMSDEEKGGPDMFGIPWIFMPEAHGSMEDPKYPHVFEDVEDWESTVTFPDPDTFDWESAKKINAAIENDDRARFVTFHNGMFERLISFMGFEGAVVALIDEDSQEDVSALFDKLADLYIELIGRLRSCFSFDGVHFHDDWGTQRGPMFSCATCQEIVAPAIKRIVDYCHSEGLWFLHHSCGLNEMTVPAMLDQGDDMWMPQPMNDARMIRAEYGDKLMIGIHPPVLPPDADVETLDALAKAYVDEFAPGFKERPFFVPDFGHPQAYKDAIYKYSRIALG